MDIQPNMPDGRNAMGDGSAVTMDNSGRVAIMHAVAAHLARRLADADEGALAGITHEGHGRPLYDEYIQSFAWTKRRVRYTLANIYACRRCHASERLQLHHRTYVRLGCEHEDDLCWLCDECHALQHRGGTLDPGPAWPIDERDIARVRSATFHHRRGAVELVLVNLTPPVPLADAEAMAVTIAREMTEMSLPGASAYAA